MVYSNLCPSLDQGPSELNSTPLPNASLQNTRDNLNLPPDQTTALPTSADEHMTRETSEDRNHDNHRPSNWSTGSIRGFPSASRQNTRDNQNLHTPDQTTTSIQTEPQDPPANSTVPLNKSQFPDPSDTLILDLTSISDFFFHAKSKEVTWLGGSIKTRLPWISKEVNNHTTNILQNVRPT